MSSLEASSSNAQATPREEAGPLPTKRGEIGYREDPHSPATSTHSTEQSIELPARHPADREAPQTPALFSPIDIPESIPTPPKDVPTKPTWYGFNIGSIVVIAVITAFIICTIVGWGFLGSAIGKGSIVSLDGTAKVIVHVVFAMIVLTQIVFLERKIFHARAERFARLNPDVLLRSRPASAAPSLVAPWNRPPLPSYAAALAQTGVGTGDVEDHLIAAPPPPAYGNTRGSTLLLAGFLRSSLRVQRPVSVVSSAERGERPMSYRSRDEQWDEYCDAQRAQQLEETLSRLQRPASALTRN